MHHAVTAATNVVAKSTSRAPPIPIACMVKPAASGTQVPMSACPAPTTPLARAKRSTGTRCAVAVAMLSCSSAPRLASSGAAMQNDHTLRRFVRASAHSPSVTRAIATFAPTMTRRPLSRSSQAPAKGANSIAGSIASSCTAP